VRAAGLKGSLLPESREPVYSGNYPPDRTQPLIFGRRNNLYRTQAREYGEFGQTLKQALNFGYVRNFA